MAKYRGSQGSLSIGGNAVGQIIDWEGNFSRPYIEATDMGDSGQEGDLDIPGGQGRLTVRFDYDDTAQAAIVDQILSNSTPTPLAALFIVSSTGPKQISCNVLFTDMGVVSRVLGGHIQATFQWRSNGAISMDWT